jgi:uncharacterized membrane protein YdbT with pleckstrin-like domain
MNYIRKTLAKNEEIKGIFHLSWINYIKTYLFILFSVSFSIFIMHFIGLLTMDASGLLYLIIGTVPMFAMAAPVILWLKSFEQGVTNRRVVLKKGLFSRDTQEIRLDAIETIDVNQSIIGRILDYGDVTVTGRGNSELHFKNIDAPIDIKVAIENAMEGRTQEFMQKNQDQES